MSGGGSGGEKTEKATPKRLKKARRDGQIGNTPELGGWAGLMVASFLLPGAMHKLMDTASASIVQVGAVIRHPDVGVAMSAAGTAVKSGFMAVFPLALVIAGISVAFVGLQGGIFFSPKSWKPKFSRMNPLSGIKRMFGPHGAWQLTKSLLKTAALSVVVYFSVRDLVPTVIGSGSLDIATLVQVATSTVLGVLRYAAVGGFVLAMADFAVVKKRNNKSLKMTKQEVKDEFKSQEGDPHVRGQRRSMQIAMSRNRMLADIPQADVVVVNPTHVAVALKYDPAKGAPRVVAKGGDHIAAKIREIAERNRVPMVADIGLARTLYKNCEIGQEIPPELFKAVATVLAFIMTLRKKGSVAGTHAVSTGVKAPESGPLAVVEPVLA